MAFGIGGSYSHSQQQSSSLGVSANVSGSQSMSDSLSQSQSTQGSQQTSQQDIAFAPLFQALYGSAGGAAATAAMAVPGLTGASQMLFSGGAQFLDQLTANPATDYLTSRVTGPDTAAAAQIGALGSNLGDFFNEQLLPGITSRGVATGGLGNSRDAIARSLAAKQVAGQYTQGVAQILGNSQQQRDAAAAQLGGLTQQGAATGLGSLGGLFSLLQGGANAGLSPYLALAQIMGGPTTLTTSQGTSYGQSTATDIAKAISQAFSQGFSYDTSQSSGSSHSTSASFGL